MISQLNHYQALGISESATLPEIKAAYKTLALKFHPVINSSFAYSKSNVN